MSETKRPIEDLIAGEKFRNEMIARADSYHHNAPLWHGWVIMDAFLAGIDHAKTRTPSPDGVREAQIDRGGQALRERQMQGRITRKWDDVPKSERRKWRDHAEAVLTAALSKPAGDE